MRGNDGKQCFSEKESGRIWNDCIEQIMSEETFGIVMWEEMH